MKKLTLLFTLITLSLASCSGDDDTTPVTNEKVLLMTTDSVYSSNNGLSQYWTTTFEDNKMSQILFYDGGGQLRRRTDCIYNSDGLLTSVLAYLYASDIGEFLNTETTYQYDDEDRLISILENSTFPGGEQSIREKTFTYNNDNTISCLDQESNGGISNSVYSLDGQGRIFMHGANGQMWEQVEYEGNEVVSRSHATGYVTNYTYDNEQEVKGQYLNSFVNQFGNYAPNKVLAFDFEELTRGIDRYRISDNLDSTFEFDYDEDGYPISRIVYDGTWSNTVPAWTTHIQYE